RPLPGFSIALVTHNRPAFLKEAIRSVLTSTTGPFELLIWDNGSDTETRDVIASYADDSRIRAFRSRRNLGTHAYALMFLKATRRYLVEMDDDILGLQHGWGRRGGKGVLRLS